MKDELPLQPESQKQDTQTDNYHSFNENTLVPSKEIAASAQTPLVDTEVEPSTSSLHSLEDTSIQDSSAFFSEPPTSELASSQSTATSTTNERTDDQLDAAAKPVPSVAPTAPDAVAPVENQPPESAEQQPVAFGGTLAPAKKSNRKKFIVIGALIGVFALLGGGTAAAYNLWYQNPDKVIGDALMNMLKAKTVTYTGAFNLKEIDASVPSGTGDDLTLTVNIDGKNSSTIGDVNIALKAKYQGGEYKLSGSGLVDKDSNLFIKANDVKKLLQSLPNESGFSYATQPSSIKDIVDKVDNKWIRLSIDDIQEFNDDYAKNKTCTEDAFKELEDNKQFSNELIKVYTDNKFILIDEKLPSKNGSLGYAISVDDGKTRDFLKAMDTTHFGKELQKCDKGFKFSSSSNLSINSDSGRKNRTELWVDRWTHQLTEASFTVEDAETDAEFIFKPKFNQPVTVEAPKEYISLKDLKKDLEDAYAQYMMSQVDVINDRARDVMIDEYKAMNEGKEPTEAEIQQLLQGNSLSTERTL